MPLTIGLLADTKPRLVYGRLFSLSLGRYVIPGVNGRVWNDPLHQVSTVPGKPGSPPQVLLLSPKPLSRKPENSLPICRVTKVKLPSSPALRIRIQLPVPVIYTSDLRKCSLRTLWQAQWIASVEVGRRIYSSLSKSTAIISQAGSLSTTLPAVDLVESCRP